ncbi:MAG: hypothetical protein HON29_00880 [Candidatus Magasanikbacteria bacterium]|jgi:hypothetical protein|nr:hypothetical protein [Candidatus Magasanikbacteria bacterium]MBT5820122.1 hypothetical protein [Candidatus Magasanikbacteria bacterium]
MTQQECKDVKAMLEEIDKSAPRFIELHKDLDSLDNLDEIGVLFLQLKKTLQDNSELRQNLKAWERRSKNIQRIDKIAEKLDKGGRNVDLSIDELHSIHMTEVWETEYGVFNFKPILDDAGDNYYRYSNLEVCRKNRSEEKQKEDHARIYGCRPEQITSKQDDVFEKNSNIVVFIGEELGFTDQKLPETLKHVSGNLQSDSKNAKLPKNLEYVGGHLVLDSLESAKGLVLPKTIGGDLYLYSLTSAEGLVLPKTIGGYLNLYSLESAKGLVLPEIVGEDLNLGSFTFTAGLEKLNYAGIMGNIYLKGSFSQLDKEEVKKIKIEQEKKGIDVTFEYL